MDPARQLYIPGSVHLSPMYPLAQLHVLLATQAPCSQAGSQITIETKKR